MKLWWFLRLLVATLLIFICFKPVMTLHDSSALHPTIVLLDVSPSMRVQDSVQRLTLAADSCLSLLKKKTNYLLYTFSNKVQASTMSFLQKPSVSGNGSNLADALKATFDQHNFSSAIVFSDGRHVGSGDPVSVAASLGRPLLLVGVGDKALFRDICIRKIQSPPFAFKNIPVRISAQISANGFSGKKVPVYLKEGEKIIATQIMDCRNAEFETEMAFEWTPTTLGSKNLTVEAAQQAGEVSFGNNRKDFSLDVGRDRFRVLYLCGDPGPDYGFLRHQFKSDPGVELVTFVILRNNSNQLSVPDSELSLIPFPTENILTQQMASFDLVVFDEFSYRRFGLSPVLLQAIKRRVEQGGSFLLMGGPSIFGPASDYHLPDIEDMFPVNFTEGLSLLPTSAAFVPTSTRHPIFQIEKQDRSNEEIWKNAPVLDEMLGGLQAKPEATVLAVASSPEKKSPVLVAWKWKQGRVAVMGARTTFRWSMQNKNAETGTLLYSQFWKNMVLWLTHSSDDKSVRLGLDEKTWVVRKNNIVRVWVFDPYFKPLSDVQVRVQATWSDKTTETWTLPMETAGVFSVSTEGKAMGPAQFQTWVTRQGHAYGNDTLNVRIHDDQSEEEDLRPDFALLSELAKVSQGRFVPISEFTPDVADEFQKQSEAKTGKKVYLWNSPWLLGLLLVFVFLEWILRKKQGLP